jgi:hypothetical protein
MAATALDQELDREILRQIDAEFVSDIDTLEDDDELEAEITEQLGRVGVEQAPQAGLDLDTMDEAAAIPQDVGGGIDPDEMAAPGRETTGKEQALMGLINEDPELQMLYLKRQGFNTQLNPETGAAEYEQAQGRWVPALEGITQYWPNIVEGLVGAAATTGKVLGAVGAPATGGASIAASAGLGAAAGAGLETVKQTGAKVLGLREEMDPGRIAEKGVTTGLGAGAGEVLGKVVGAGARGLKKALVGKQRGFGGDLASQAAVKSAAKELDVVPTPGMLTKDPTIRKVEAALDSLEFTPGGMLTRARSKNIKAAINETAEELVRNRSLKTSYEVGKDFEKKVTESIAKKLEPAEKLYGEIRDQLGEIPLNRQAIKGYFSEIMEGSAKWDFTGSEQKVMDQVFKKLNEASNVNDLKVLRSKLAKSIDRNASQGLRELHDGLYEVLTKVRQDSFELAVQRSKGTENYGELFSKLKEADKIWKDTSKEVANVFSGPSKKVKFGPKALSAKALRETDAEKALDKFFPRQDLDQARSLLKLSPEGFRELATARVASIADKAVSKGEGRQGKILFGALSREIDKLSPEIAKAIFGTSAIQKQKAAKILFQNVPFDINPSGTAKTQNILGTVMKHIQSMSLSTLGTLTRASKPLQTEAGKGFLKSLTKAGLITGAGGLTKIMRDENASEKRDKK